MPVEVKADIAAIALQAAGDGDNRQVEVDHRLVEFFINQNEIPI